MTMTSHGQRSLGSHDSYAVASGTLNGQEDSGTYMGSAVEGSASPQAIQLSPSNVGAPVRNQQGQPAAMRCPEPSYRALLADPLLALAADVLDDLERTRIANENRLRQLTRNEADSDGEIRGFGLDQAHPDVARLAALVDMLATAEHQAELNLGRLMRNHALGPWLKAQRGIGDKQGARLLAAIGDPYMRPEMVREDGTVEPPRPRMVSELWALCGYHVIPAAHALTDAQSRNGGGEQAGNHPGQLLRDAQSQPAGLAPKRARGQKANWSATARKRAYLVAVSCMKAGGPYRAVYDEARAKYAAAIHCQPCAQCGAKGKPAQPGSSLSDGHKHARALRAVAKEVLKQLWREARRIHEDHNLT